ncbi:MAG TPA: type II toxin-antitoxin system RelE/ParE family toxin [Kofleriaceae bacterium]|nr:type II toxin-antitoxin system RelE/ParE family toxin [Kofleriaceae bacterium]
MKRALRVRPEAEEELLAAAEWYEGRKLGLGVDLVAAVDEVLERLVSAPFASPGWRSQLPHRFCTLRRFPYLIFYVADEEVVEVVSIAHAKRRPGYWRDR